MSGKYSPNMLNRGSCHTLLPHCAQNWCNSCFTPKECDFSVSSPWWMTTSCRRGNSSRYPFLKQMVQLQLPTFWSGNGGERVTVYWVKPQWQLAAWVEVWEGSKVGRLAMKAFWVSFRVSMVVLRSLSSGIRKVLLHVCVAGVWWNQPSWGRSG